VNQILQWVEIRASGEELLFSETKRYICFDLDSLDTLTQPCNPPFPCLASPYFISL